jgi:tetratricopeptide (TPR) repeat protein
MHGVGNRFSKWPGRTNPERLRPFCTPEISPKFVISPGENVFTIGSCFARNIEEYLARYGLSVPTLAFQVPQDEYLGRSNGILNKYTPPSILNEINFALNDDRSLPLDDHFIFLDATRVVDLHLNSDIPVTLDRARQRRTEVRRVFGGLRDASVVVITLGLIEAWYDNEKQIFVNQAPPPPILRRDDGRFTFHCLDYDECRQALDAIIGVLNGSGVPKKIVVTVSPVPLGRTFTADDAIIANAASKATLRAAAGSIARAWPNVQYFPSYEMATISDPASIWAAHDQLHLRDDAVGRIIERFIDVFCPATPNSEHGAARMQLSAGAPEAAYATLKRLERTLSGPLYLRDFIEACSKTGRLAEAIALCHRLVAAEPDNGESFFLLCREAIRGEAYPEALVAIDRAIALAGRVAKYHDYRRVVLDRLGRIEEAAAAAEAALRFLPEDFPNYDDYAQSYVASAVNLLCRAGMTSRAVALFEVFERFGEHYPAVMRAASRAFEAIGDLDRATAYAAMEADRTHAFVACRRYGELAMRMGRCADAADGFARALRSRPDDLVTLRQLAEMLRRDGRLADAAGVEARIHEIAAASG